MKGILKVVGIIVLTLVASMVNSQSTNPTRVPTDDDVIEQLRLAGSNLSKPHPIDFYIYVPSKVAAERIAAVLTDRGFQVKVELGANDSGWLALASKHIVPTSSALAQLRHELSALAQSEHGDYDGWEAAVVK